MKTHGVSSSILSAVRNGVANQLTGVAKWPFDGASIQLVEKQFIETFGQSASHGLTRLFSCNDETRKTIILDGQKHYRKYFATGRYLTLIGEISLKRGIYQSNIATRSICPVHPAGYAPVLRSCRREHRMGPGPARPVLQSVRALPVHRGDGAVLGP